MATAVRAAAEVEVATAVVRAAPPGAPAALVEFGSFSSTACTMSSSSRWPADLDCLDKNRVTHCSGSRGHGCSLA